MGGVPGAGDGFVGNSVAGDGEEAGLAADFVDLVAEGFLFGRRGVGEFGEIENWKGRHFVGLGCYFDLSLSEP